MCDGILRFVEIGNIGFGGALNPGQLILKQLVRRAFNLDLKP